MNEYGLTIRMSSFINNSEYAIGFCTYVHYIPINSISYNRVYHATRKKISTHPKPLQPHAKASKKMVQLSE